MKSLVLGTTSAPLGGGLFAGIRETRARGIAGAPQKQIVEASRSYLFLTENLWGGWQVKEKGEEKKNP